RSHAESGHWQKRCTPIFENKNYWFHENSVDQLEIVTESHDPRGGRTRNRTIQRKLLVTRKSLSANQNSYAGHMICEEVAPEIAPITG
ncbi:hypothetical protein V1478_017102, partial [Vespula squamosa]